MVIVSCLKGNSFFFLLSLSQNSRFTNEAKEKIFEKLKQLPTKTKHLKNAKEEYLKELSGKTEAENSTVSTNNAYQSVLDCMSSTPTGYVPLLNVSQHCHATIITQNI